MFSGLTLHDRLPQSIYKLSHNELMIR